MERKVRTSSAVPARAGAGPRRSGESHKPPHSLYPGSKSRTASTSSHGTYCESRPPGQAVVAVRSSSKGVPAPPQLASPLLAHLAAWTPCWRARRRTEPETRHCTRTPGRSVSGHVRSPRRLPPPPFRPVGTDPSLADDMAGPGSSFGARRKAVKKGLQFTLLVVGASSTCSTVSSSRRGAHSSFASKPQASLAQAARRSSTRCARRPSLRTRPRWLPRWRTRSKGSRSIRSASVRLACSSFPCHCRDDQADHPRDNARARRARGGRRPHLAHRRRHARFR